MPIHETINSNIAELVMDNPPVNALNTKDTFALSEILNSYKKSDVRVVILTAQGKGFSAGVDIKEIQSFEGNEGILRANQSCFELFKSIYECAVPVIVAVNDFCLGTGIGIAGSADMVISAEGVVFGLPEVDNGALGAATHLQRLVSPQRAREMLYTCDTATAQELFEYGSLHKVVPADRLMETARELAEKIAKKSPKVIRAAKRSLNGIDPIDMVESYRYEQGYTFELNLMGVGDEARDAFLHNKRDKKKTSDS